MARPVVSVQRCPDYTPATVSTAVQACLAPLGGLEAFVRPGDRVFCKLNLLMPAAPDKAITTHPEVLRAVLARIRDLGATPIVGDNPAVPSMRMTLKRCGFLPVLKEFGLQPVDLKEGVRVETPEPRAYHSFELSRAIVEADVLLNLAKLKTHTLAFMTLAVKNLFGLIWGLEKSRWHVRAPTASQFATLLVDLLAATRSQFADGTRMLHIVDGVLALEGDGPSTGGSPRPVGLLAAAQDAVALDRVLIELAGLDPTRLQTCTQASERGLGEGDLKGIDLQGGSVAELRIDPPLKPPKGSKLTEMAVWPLNTPWLRNRLVERPIVHPAKCTGCGQCARICAAKAIEVGKETMKAGVEIEKCIRCYCCAEVCPEAAVVKSDTPLAVRLLGSKAALIGLGIGVLGVIGAAVGLGIWWVVG